MYKPNLEYLSKLTPPYTNNEIPIIVKVQSQQVLHIN